MNSQNSPKIPKPLVEIKPANKRSMARLGAVQALYQMELTDAALGDVLAEFESHHLGSTIDPDEGEAAYRDADAQWFRAIVKGVVSGQKQIDPQIHAALPADWPLKRLEILLRAILRAGLFELIDRKDVPVAVIVNEYVDIANAFYDEGEPRMVNAVLDRLAKQIRSEASSDQSENG